MVFMFCMRHYMFMFDPNETKNGQLYFSCDKCNGLAATRPTKMVLVTVSSTIGYLIYIINKLYLLIITLMLFATLVRVMLLH